MTAFDGLGLRNRRTIPFAALPMETVPRFRDTVCQAVRDGWRLVAFFGMPGFADRIQLVAILAQDERGQLGALTTLVDGSYPALTPECPEAHLLRAGDRGAVRRRSGGAPVAQAGPPASTRRGGPAGVEGDGGAGGVSILPDPRRRGSRGRRGTGARGHHRTGAFPLPGTRRGGALPRDHARLSASGSRASAGDAPMAGRRPGRGVDRRRYRYRACERRLRCHRGAGPEPQDAQGADHPRHRPRAGAPGQSHRRSRRDRGRHRLPARRGVLRADAG